VKRPSAPLLSQGAAPPPTTSAGRSVDIHTAVKVVDAAGSGLSVFPCGPGALTSQRAELSDGDGIVVPMSQETHSIPEQQRRGPCSGIESEVADRVESVMPVEGITPDQRVCHDGQKGHLRVDFVYPNARPGPLALEVTAIVASEDEAGSRASVALTERVTETAEAEGLGAWLVAVQMDRDMRRLGPEILKVIRDAQTIRERLLANGGSIRPGVYSSEELMRLPRDRWSAFIAEHERLKELGLNDVTPVHMDRENFIGVLPMRTGIVRGFDDELQERVNAKASVLGQAPDLQRHLAVLVDRWDVSGNPESMPVPELPPTIDVLWVVHRWSHERDRPEVWVTRRWRSSWNVQTPD
jgi:hypothetical protein